MYPVSEHVINEQIKYDKLQDKKLIIERAKGFIDNNKRAYLKY